MALLRHVDEVEIGGEGPHEQAGLGQAQSLRALEQAPSGLPEIGGERLAAAQGLGAGAVVLDEGEALLALLLA